MEAAREGKASSAVRLYSMDVARMKGSPKALTHLTNQLPNSGLFYSINYSEASEEIIEEQATANEHVELSRMPNSQSKLHCHR